MEGGSTINSLPSESPSPAWSSLALWLVCPVKQQVHHRTDPSRCLRNCTALTGFAGHVKLILLAYATPSSGSEYLTFSP
jgi:hypothetical protein